MRLSGIGVCLAVAAMVFGPQQANADILVANTTANNGGATGWAQFTDFTSLGPDLTITHMDSWSTAAAGAGFTVTVFTRSGSGLGGPVASGPGSSSAGWTNIGTANATQGGTGNGLSLLIDIPDIFVAAGSTVGVAFQFTGAGVRYFGTGTAPIQNFSDANLQITTGNSRSVPFTTTGSFFSSRGLAGSVTYFAVPEPGTAGVVALIGLAAFCRRRSRA